MNILYYYNYYIILSHRIFDNTLSLTHYHTLVSTTGGSGYGNGYGRQSMWGSGGQSYFSPGMGGGGGLFGGGGSSGSLFGGGGGFGGSSGSRSASG